MENMRAAIGGVLSVDHSGRSLQPAIGALGFHQTKPNHWETGL